MVRRVVSPNTKNSWSPQLRWMCVTHDGESKTIYLWSKEACWFVSKKQQGKMMNKRHMIPHQTHSRWLRWYLSWQEIVKEPQPQAGQQQAQTRPSSWLLIEQGMSCSKGTTLLQKAQCHALATKEKKFSTNFPGQAGLLAKFRQIFRFSCENSVAYAETFAILVRIDSIEAITISVYFVHF